MTFYALALVLAGILSFSDYITENFFSKQLRESKKIISFSGGVGISYVVLNLFPEISSYSLINGRAVFLYVLAGFVSLNLIEQFIYKEVKKINSYHKGVHITYFFVYKFLIGMVLASFASEGLTQTMLFFIPFLLYIIAEILPQEFDFKSKTFKVFYTMAPLFGAVFGIQYLEFVNSIFGPLISLITGTLLYIVIRESLPSDKAEKPIYFLIGVISYSLVIFMSWNFF